MSDPLVCVGLSIPVPAAVALVEPDYKVKVFWDPNNPPDDPNYSQEVRGGRCRGCSRGCSRGA